MSVYIVTTINTKINHQSQKYTKMTKICCCFFNFFLFVCVCVFITVQAVSYIRKIAVMSSSPNIYCQSFSLSPSRAGETLKKKSFSSVRERLVNSANVSVKAYEVKTSMLEILHIGRWLYCKTKGTDWLGLVRLSQMFTCGMVING